MSISLGSDFVGPDLGLSCLQRLSADEKVTTSKERVNAILYLFMNKYNKIMHFGTLFNRSITVNRERTHKIFDLIKCMRK